MISLRSIALTLERKFSTPTEKVEILHKKSHSRVLQKDNFFHIFLTFFNTYILLIQLNCQISNLLL